MTEEQVRKFAKFAQRMSTTLCRRDDKNQLVDSIYYKITGINEHLRKTAVSWENCHYGYIKFNNNTLNNTKEIMEICKTKIEKLINELSEHTNSPKIQPSSVEDIAVEIKDLLHTFKSVSFNAKIKTISVITRSDIIIDDYNFGKYKIILRLVTPNTYKTASKDTVVINTIKIKALSPKQAKYSGYIHPHISTYDGPCFGETIELLFNALKFGRIKDVFVICETFLKSYGEEPYEEIERWHEMAEDKEEEDE